MDAVMSFSQHRFVSEFRKPLNFSSFEKLIFTHVVSYPYKVLSLCSLLFCPVRKNAKTHENVPHSPYHNPHSCALIPFKETVFHAKMKRDKSEIAPLNNSQVSIVFRRRPSVLPKLG
ncbi:unnamed protein product [Amoebophrya sp. A120]|nr:unnamed protein product [Amoebophrya sp. A120]|eukprot:GSA120T00011904001.1